MAGVGVNNFPGGFNGSLTIRGTPIAIANPGKVFWVSNATTVLERQIGGSDGNPGTYDKPFATIYKGVSSCVANRGDIVFVKPGHAETLADAATLLLNVAGVSVVGLGAGSMRPTITLSAAASNIPITAANCAMVNFLFKPTHADVASVFTATGTATPTDFSVERCEFRDGSSILNIMTIVTGNATANSLDGLTFVKNRISSLGTTAATTAIKFASDTDRVILLDNVGNWAVLNDTACFVAAGTTQLTNIDCGRNILQKPNTSSTGGSFVSGSGNAWTGHFYDNYMFQVDGTAGIWIATGHGTSCGFTNNFSPITGAADKNSIVNPVQA